MKSALQIIPVDLLEEFCSGFDHDMKHHFSELHDNELSIDTFSFYTSLSAVFSSKIEGEDIELDSFIKHKRFGTHHTPDYTQKVDDLYDAYLYAQQNKLTTNSLMRSHAMLTRNILHPSQQGEFRKGKMFVVTKDGKIDYAAASPHLVKEEMNKLYEDVDMLLSDTLTFEEAFYFASMLHLAFVKIHPFEDGNGRTARLLEKWFLAEKLGSKAWFIPSEKYYFEHHQQYYHHIRLLGLEYEELNYSLALPFLQMLTKSFSGVE